MILPDLRGPGEIPDDVCETFSVLSMRCAYLMGNRTQVHDIPHSTFLRRWQLVQYRAVHPKPVSNLDLCRSQATLPFLYDMHVRRRAPTFVESSNPEDDDFSPIISTHPSVLLRRPSPCLNLLPARKPRPCRLTITTLMSRKPSWRQTIWLEKLWL